MKNLIRKKRKEANISQGILAERCGWEQGRISHYETGRRSPGIDDLEIIAKALGITIHDLLDSDGDSQQMNVEEHNSDYYSINQTRHHNLLRLVSSFDNQNSLAAAIGVSPGYINQLVNKRRPITEKTARKIEKTLSLKSGFLDQCTTVDISDKLRLLMNHDPIVQGNENALARQSGVPQPTIHRILAGESHDPRRSTIEKLAAYFKIPTNDFYSPTPYSVNEPREQYTEAAGLESLKKEHKKLISLYDTASPKVQMAIMVLLEREAEHMEAGLPKLDMQTTRQGKTSGNKQ